MLVLSVFEHFFSSVRRIVKLKVLMVLDCGRHVGAYLLIAVGRLVMYD